MKKTVLVISLFALTSLAGPMLEIKNDRHFQKEVIEAKGPVIVDFYAKWCGPCQRLAPIFDKAAAKNKNIKFVRVDTDLPGNEAICRKYKIRSIPTLILFRGGKSYIDESELMSSEGELNALIDEASRP